MRRRATQTKKRLPEGQSCGVVLAALLGAVLFFLSGRSGIRIQEAVPTDEEMPYQQVALEERTLENKYYYGQLPQGR